MPKSDTRHPDYDENEYTWFSVRAAVKGPQMVKRANSLFLPIPAAMLNAPPPSYSSRADNTGPKDFDLQIRSPNYHPNPAYAAYKTRAHFPQISSNTLRGLLGIALKSEPIVELPSSLQYMVDDTATASGENLVDLYKFVLSEILQTGRCVLVLDVNPQTDRIYIAPYTAESFINWRSGIVGGMVAPTLLVFEEEISNPEDEDIFTHEMIDTQRVMLIDESGHYTQQLYTDNNPIGQPVQPSYRGRRLPFLPAVVAGSTNFDLTPDISPLSGISDTAMHIYMKDADLSQSQYMTANPLLCFRGVNADDVPNVVGATVAIAIPNENGDAKYVEVTANGLNSLQNSIDRLYDRAMEQGASLLGGTVKAAESGEALRMRQESSGATLKGVVENAGRAITMALKMAATWMGESTDGIVFDPITEFSDNKLSAQEMTALLQMWMNKSISFETYYDNLQKGGVAKEDVTADEEMDKIEQEQPAMVGPSPELQNAMGGQQPAQDETQMETEMGESKDGPDNQPEPQRNQ